MFRYTKNAILETFDLVKNLIYFFQLALQVGYLWYIIYRTAAGTGDQLINIILLPLALVYFIVQLITTQEFYTKRQSINRRWVRWVYKITKYSVNIYIIVLTLNTLFKGQAPNEDMTIITTVLLIIGILVSLVSEIVMYFIDRQIDLINNSFLYDIEVFQAHHEKKAWAINKLGFDLDEMFPDRPSKQAIDRIKKVQKKQELKKVRKVDFDHKNK